MPLNQSAVGAKSGPIDVSWTSRDSLLYALGVGAGQANALDELNFTTENSAGVTQQVLPTYAVVIVQNAHARPDLGDIDRTKLVHAEQGFELHAPLPVEGKVRVTSEVTGMYDKGSGALVSMSADAVDAATGKLLISTTSSIFIRGEGGFGGSRGVAGGQPMPETRPDQTIVVPTRADQALLYRLSGDRNPLHSDPTFSSRGGFERPILHGLCTYGITGRTLLHACCGGDPLRIRAMSARFTRPVLPGETLTVMLWSANNGGSPTFRFRTLGPHGQPVIDHGVLTLN